MTSLLFTERLRDLFKTKPLLFFGSGMSCALDDGFGMPALANTLLHKMEKDKLCGKQRDEWEKFKMALDREDGLEKSLNSVEDKELIKKIIDIAGSSIAELDKKYSFKITKKESEWPATKILKTLVGNLHEGDRILHVITTNYDMLLEHACDSERIAYTDGFFGGIERRIDWEIADKAFQETSHNNYKRNQKKSTKVSKNKQHIRLYKVHGSLNYFCCHSDQEEIVENNAWMWAPPPFAERVMISPGVSKYKKLHQYRKELLEKSDSAIREAQSFLFLGYGFNDDHLEKEIRKKLTKERCPGLIITKYKNPSIENLLEKSPNLWLVCKSDENSPNGSVVINKHLFPEGEQVPDKNIWEIDEFNTYILGN